MTKKIVSTVLIPLLLLQLYSCYSMTAISRAELINQRGKEDIRVTTRQNEIFEFKSLNYYVKSDTLFGTGEKIMDNFTSVPFSGKIAIENIEFISENKVNASTTFLAVVGVVLIGALVYGIIVMQSINQSISGCNQRT